MKTTKLELQFFVHLVGLHFHVSYINAIILPACNNKYSVSLCACIHTISSVTFFFGVCFKFSYFLDTIAFLVLLETFKLCLVKPCAHSFISG